MYNTHILHELLHLYTYVHTLFMNNNTTLTVSVNFLLLESACLSKDDSCNTVS